MHTYIIENKNSQLKFIHKINCTRLGFIRTTENQFHKKKITNATKTKRTATNQNPKKLKRQRKEN